MARFALGISYQGNGYCGWQRQPLVSSVQACIEDALSKMACTPITITTAGRTDKGVHAVGQVVDFETNVSRPLVAWTKGVNCLLPSDIRIHWAREVSDTFSARKSALWRHYLYIIYPSSVPPAIYREGVTWIYKSLNVKAMQSAAKCWLGEHDFSAFRGAGCQAHHAIRRLLSLEVYREGPLVIFSVVANAFLLHMVRNFVGTLLKIGYEEAPIEWAAEVLQSRDRKAAGPTAPANGLYLYRVGYPSKWALPNGPHEKWCLPGNVEKNWQVEYELV